MSSEEEAETGTCGGGGAGGGVPANFASVVLDMTTDLSTTFPEFAPRWTRVRDMDLAELYAHCASVYPERFFEILYQDTGLFEGGEARYFLPEVDFRELFHCAGVSESTRAAIWKYLQLMLFTVVGGVRDGALFGPEAAEKFETLDAGSFNAKLSETVENLSRFFGKHLEESGGGVGDENGDGVGVGGEGVGEDGDGAIGK